MNQDNVPPPCDPDIFENGEQVMLTHTIGSLEMEAWVQKVARKSCQWVDWHFSGGRAVVLAVGDVDRVRQAILDLMPEHNELQRKAVGDLGVVHWEPSCLLY